MPRRSHATTDVEGLEQRSRADLRVLWADEFKQAPPSSLGRDILALGIAYARQERRYGGLSKSVAKELTRLMQRVLGEGTPGKRSPRSTLTVSPLPRAGTILVREWQGVPHQVTVTSDGFLWNGSHHRSLSGIARAITGTAWNGHRFFGLRDQDNKPSGRPHDH